MSNPVVLVYSHRPEVREQIMSAVGRRPAPDVGRIDFLECESVSDVLMAVDGHRADLVDPGRRGPADRRDRDLPPDPHGGRCVIPPIVLVVRRADDRWLATWSQADEVLVHPLDPVTAAETVAEVLRRLPVVVRPAH